MSRGANVRFNNRSNKISNNRIYSAPYCAKKNKVSNGRAMRLRDEVYGVSYRKVRVKLNGSGRKASNKASSRFIDAFRFNGKRESAKAKKEDSFVGLLIKMICGVSSIAKKINSDVRSNVKKIYMAHEYMFRDMEDIKIERAANEMEKIFGVH